MRATIAYVISSIASWDWPDDWPELFDILMSALASSDTDAVHGSMRVLTGEPSKFVYCYVFCVCLILLTPKTCFNVCYIPLPLYIWAEENTKALCSA